MTSCARVAWPVPCLFGCRPPLTSFRSTPACLALNCARFLYILHQFSTCAQGVDQTDYLKSSAFCAGLQAWRMLSSVCEPGRTSQLVSVSTTAELRAQWACSRAGYKHAQTKIADGISRPSMAPTHTPSCTVGIHIHSFQHKHTPVTSYARAPLTCR
jgi:hypothetical protein